MKFVYNPVTDNLDLINDATTVTTLDSQAANANGAAITNGALSLQSADATHPGVVNNTTQSFSGNKTFTGTVGASNLSGTNTGDVTIGTFGSSPTAKGISISGQVITLQPADGSNAGAISTTTQTIAGAKTFSGALTASSTLSVGGALNMNSHLINNVTDPSGAQDAATKNYVDGQINGLSISSYFKKDGSVAATGDFNLNTHKLTNVVDPASAQDAATKNYVDTNLGLKMCVVTDSKTNGTNGGTSTAGSWQTRNLNTLTDNNSGVTVASNQLSIPAGTWYIQTATPFHGIVNRANTRLQNITNSATLLSGSSVCSTGGGTTFHSFITGIFTISGTKTVELQYQVQTAAGAGQDLGFSSGGIFTVASEIYTQITLIKLA